MPFTYSDSKITEIIDIHSHIFPQTLAPRAVSSIGSFYELPTKGKGTPKDLHALGIQAGIDYFVVSSTATTPEQVPTINNFFADVCSQFPSFFGFGTIHPEFPNVEAEINRVLTLGLRGIKIHPDFQKYNIDHPLMFPIYEAIEGRLPILFHIGDYRMDFSNPVRLSKILDSFPKLTAIAAHLGGYRVWDDWGRTLIGRNVYIDTSSSLMFLDQEKATNIIRSHGVDKVLFGTDYPMWFPRQELKRFLALGLTEDENRKILSNNARKVLGYSDAQEPPIIMK